MAKPAVPPNKSKKPAKAKPAAKQQAPPIPFQSQPTMSAPQSAPAGGDPSGGIPSMQTALPGGLEAGSFPTTLQTNPQPQISPGAQQAVAAVQKGMAKTADPQAPRPEIPERTRAQVAQWWYDTDNLSQRANALFEFREANKTLFPARFDITDPLRGRIQMERKAGRDKRRVNIPRIFRDTMQTTAMTVPDDIDFTFQPVAQAEPPSDPLLPTTNTINPVTGQFGKTLTIVERALLDEANFVEKFQAWVQDSSTYPMAVLKYCFRRDFNTTYLKQTPPDKDTSDAAARLEALVGEYANKSFGVDDARFQQMLDLVKSLQSNTRLTRWFGLDLQLLPLDSFGISEDVVDIVNVYDSRFMFQDVLKTGEELLTAFPYTGEVDENGNSFGLTEAEVSTATAWNQDNSSTDAYGAQSRGRNNSNNAAPRASTIASSKTSSTAKMDPKKQKYLVREIWCKQERTVYTFVRGVDHCVNKRIPQKTSERWYPFAILAPNRVPTELYAASDLELKRDVQDRYNRKRSDEEKARWLSMDRLIYNTQLLDGKEAVRLADIPPGHAVGINLGSTNVKIQDAIMPFAYTFNPEAFDTSKDERDMDLLGALPVQALGQTGVANYAAEVETAVQGAAVAVKQRQGSVRRAAEGLLSSLAEVLLQEVTPEEARLIAGPFAFWPVVYDENEAASIMDAARNAALQQVAPQVMGEVAQNTLLGMPVDPQQIQQSLERLAAPLWQAAIAQQYGSTEIPTRESIYRRLSVKVRSTLLSTLDRQSRIQSITLLSQALAQMTTAAQLAGVPFNPRGMLKKAAMLLDENEDFDEMFPAVSPLTVAMTQMQQNAEQQPGEEGGEKPDGGAPSAQGDQAKQGTSEEKSRGATEGGGRPDPMEAATSAV